ncbi:acyl homoserine lactone synthase [Litoreibacter ponti]|uniref:Acyl-homoserine-lactone synthase n=1 Tax=Litoreibacter ponti TaxID=1510457 RepID=A0A2T6BM66_9RHOB|nr:acyl-homoserine-lactone synthase [Litoreibacter ponti]PTX57142.1 acyl homoserine lactone synthase [Litoreibacter ponti]
MLRYVYADDLHKFPKLCDTMFRHRAEQFRTRLGWDVQVDENGWERDAYDDKNPLYVIWERADGSHGGSMRFLPTTGDTMVNDHFLHCTDGTRIESPLIWECTRFCLAPDADRRVTAALVLGAGEVMQNFCLMQFVGVFDPRMERIYSLLGVCPEVIGRNGEGADEIGVGLWSFDESARPRVQGRAKVTQDQSRQWFKMSFQRGGPVAAPVAEQTGRLALA